MATHDLNRVTKKVNTKKGQIGALGKRAAVSMKNDKQEEYR